MNGSARGRSLEREVSSLQQGAAWIESWLQSGFTPPPPLPGATVAPRSRAKAPLAKATLAKATLAKATLSSEAPTPEAPTPSPPVVLPAVSDGVLAGPMTALSGAGRGYLGAWLLYRPVSSRRYTFGAELGFATQMGLGTDSFRRVLSVGPVLGASWALSSHWALQPKLGLGIAAGASRENGCTNHGGAGYLSLGSLLAYEISSSVSFVLGLEGRALKRDLLGSATTTCATTATGEVDDDAGAETTVTAALPAEAMDATYLSLLAGIEWRFGGAP